MSGSPGTAGLHSGDDAGSAAHDRGAMTRNTSAYDRLRNLPAYFRGGEAGLRFGWSSKTTSQYLYNWQGRGYIQRFGGHSDVYANLIVNPAPNHDIMLRLAMPSAIIIGVDALRRAGWTTQVQWAPDVAVSRSVRIYLADRFNIMPFPAAWFRQNAEFTVRPARTTGRQTNPLAGLWAGPLVLEPEFALAEMLGRHNGWAGTGLDPDDIDWPGEPFEGDRWREAMRHFDLAEDTVRQWAGHRAMVPAP